jgi:membrane protein DedA with SNARE-associated domain
MKVFTWASGIVGVPMLQYMLSMAIGRGKRVYLLAAAIRLGGPRAEAMLRRYIEPVGWGATVLVAALVSWIVWKAKFAA